MKGIPVYGHTMHEFVLREAELGTRVAMCQDAEDSGWSAIDDLTNLEHLGTE